MTAWRFIDAEKTSHSVRLMCEVLKVSRSAYYQWARGKHSARVDDRKLRVHMRALHRQSRQTYGSPRMTKVLKTQGFDVNRKRVARLMREEEFTGCAEDDLSPIGRTLPAGDTFRLTLDDGTGITLRLLGVDCPETHVNDKCARDEAAGHRSCEEQIPLGLKAKVRAQALLANQRVSLEPGDGGFEWDVYDRLLAYVRLPDDRDLGLVLLEEGLCSDFSWRYPHARQAEYRAADTLGP